MVAEIQQQYEYETYQDMGKDVKPPTSYKKYERTSFSTSSMTEGIRLG